MESKLVIMTLFVYYGYKCPYFTGIHCQSKLINDLKKISSHMTVFQNDGCLHFIDTKNDTPVKNEFNSYD